MIERIKYNWHDYLANPLPKAWSALVYSKDRYKKSDENYRSYIHRLKDLFKKVEKAGDEEWLHGHGSEKN